MEDLVIVNGVLERYLGDTEKVTVPNEVNTIAPRAFEDCKTVKQIVLPEGVIRIGSYAFRNCRKLQTIVIPKSVEAIEMVAFGGCWNLREISLPGVTVLGDEAFYDCRYLVTIVAPNLSFDNASIQKKKDEALQGFIKRRKEYTNENVIAGYRKYLANRRKNILQEIVSEDKVELLLDLDAEKKITKKNVDAEYLAPAEAADAQQCIVFLKDWKTHNLNNMQTKATRDDPVKKVTVEEQREIKDVSEGINGLVFVLEGELSFSWNTKNEVKEFLELYGAKLSSSVTSKTDYFVTDNQGAETAKSKKALELGIPVVSMEEFEYMIGRRFKDEGKAQIATPSWTKILYYGAFESHKNLEMVRINEGVIRILFCAFTNCKKLSSVTVPASVNYIDKGAFSNCGAFTMFAPAGSYAEEYAKANSIPCVNKM